MHCFGIGLMKNYHYHISIAIINIILHPHLTNMGFYELLLPSPKLLCRNFNVSL